MSCPRKLEVIYEDRDPKKWRVPLREDMFHSLIPQSEGSLFSPLLFGKFFDPSDAFPLWEFESDILLASLRNSGNSTTDWFEAEGEYVLRAESPGLRHCNIQVIVKVRRSWRSVDNGRRRRKLLQETGGVGNGGSEDASGGLSCRRMRIGGR
ncbi:hypothetical protein Syun_027065 [Stephania yunnanensis]|uniref:Uncharacterized protein n=1 Tax=Stephania yunnanensis TaxID=152371 RepID=A0AAP0ENQ4_9MAGN